MIELQRKLLGDHVRNHAFADAMKKVIKPGMTVLDLGSGTGFLGFLASRLGAKHVTFVESGEILEASKKLAKRNKIGNCTFINKHSTEIKDLPKVDVLISETLGNYALEENMIESIEDAKRFLKPDGVIIPGVVRQYVAPITSDDFAKSVDVWNDVGFDLVFDEAREIGQNNMYVKTIPTNALMKKGEKEWDTVDFSAKNKSVRTKTITWEIGIAATVHGFALWWDSELVPGVTLSTSPFEKPTHWEQIYLPILESVAMEAGDKLALTLTSDTRWQTKINLAWSVQQIDASGVVVSTQSMDMKKGYIN